jgi:RimJ/RimL family protein N-acetyltransferase
LFRYGPHPASPPNPPDLRLVALAPDELALIARGGLPPLATVRGWPHRETLPLLWTAWQAGGPAWLVTAGGPLRRDAAGNPAANPKARDAARGATETGVLVGDIPHPGGVVGECAVKGPLIRGAPAEIGYGLAPGVRGRGYGQAMVSQLVSTLVTAGVSEIGAHTEVGNAASRRLLERAGFRLSGAGQDASSVCYVLTV